MSDGGLGSGYLALLWALSLAVAVLMGIWAGRVGERSKRSFGMCFLLGFFLGIIGVLIVYLISRPRTARSPANGPDPRGARPEASGRKHVVCPRCGNLIPGEAESCEYCVGSDGSGGGDST